MIVRRVAVVVGSIVFASLAAGNALANLGLFDRLPMPTSFGLGQARAAYARADDALTAFNQTRSPETLALAGRESIKALRRTSLDHRAARVLGFVSLERGREAMGAAQLRLAERMSRRNLAVQLWMIETHVARNDLNQVLRHYDIALRTNSNSGALLFPILAGAMSAPEMKTAFARFVRQPPVWMNDFATYATERGPEPAAFSTVIRYGGGLRKDQNAPAAKRVLTALFDRNLDDEALRFYSSMPRVARDVHQRVDFSPDTVDADRSPATWGAGRAAPFNVSVERGREAGSLQFRVWAPSGSGGVALHKALMLAPGRYRFNAPVGIVRGTSRTRASWKMRCTVWAKGSPMPEAKISGTVLRVPAGCITQRLEFFIENEEAGGDSEYLVRSPTLA